MPLPDSAGRTANRRGRATRRALLSAAVDALATGDPAAVSANRIAKAIGVTWGTIQYQFGDADGFWAAVLHHTAERRGDTVTASDSGASLRARVAGIVDTLYDGLEAPDSRAIENLRAALPRDPTELDRLYPATAAELRSWGQTWADMCQRAFADLNVDPDRVHKVAMFIPGAMRGLVSEKQLGSFNDLDVARDGLTSAIVAYLAGSGATG
ncbi:TetR/AcrR family transcriptional regulator [Mycolicibacterium obuense]|uniref:TetR/AcrR family transcriptional regulator n=1 Tax=Mycolicibacterium obuense TaxID=1807 RepID=A0A4R5XBV0_9MYCO|nr:TetR/AcrR family transcriptional regulator [Mycolicibacterium obuense]OKH65295.1 TetR family transcriptional regulator [Mycobacterium sp. SWH-M1]TDL12117.1 TetR/AcrR family transcriptional regulator [Mycolicibacterium obuense]